MFKKYKKLALAMAAVGVVALPLSVKAASTTLDATATFLTALNLTAQDMDFGSIELSGTAGSGDTVTMDTTGARVCVGNFSCTGSGTAGIVDITTGSNGNVVDIYCSTTATLSDGTNTIGVDNIQVQPEGGTAANCQGLSGSGTPAANMTLAVGGGGDQLTFGGRINGATATGTVGAGTYNTSNGGGAAITVEVFYQ